MKVRNKWASIIVGEKLDGEGRLVVDDEELVFHDSEDEAVRYGSARIGLGESAAILKVVKVCRRPSDIISEEVE